MWARRRTPPAVVRGPRARARARQPDRRSTAGPRGVEKGMLRGSQNASQFRSNNEVASRCELVKLAGSVGVAVLASRASSPTLELSTNPDEFPPLVTTSPVLSPQPCPQLGPIGLTESASVPNLSDQAAHAPTEGTGSLSPPASSDQDSQSPAGTSPSPARHPLIRSVTEPLDGQVQHIQELSSTTGRKAAPTRSVTAAPNGHTGPSQASQAAHDLEKPFGVTLNAAQALRLVTAKSEMPEGFKEGQNGMTKSATCQSPLVLDKFSLHETKSVSPIPLLV